MELRPYQQLGVDFLTSAKRCILADEMGVGKTPQLIMAATGKTLVVAPPSLHLNWQREIDAWKPGAPGDLFHVTSYHSLVDPSVKDGRGQVAGKLKESFVRDWETVIFDEAHHLKGRNTGYAKAGAQVLAPMADNLFLATGTPVKNWAHELFMLLRAIYPKDKRFSSYWRWADTWFSVYEDTVYRGNRQPLKIKKVGNLRSVTTWEHFIAGNGLTDRWLRREITDPAIGLDIPETNLVEVPLRMKTAQLKAYRDLERDFFAKIGDQELIQYTTGGQWQDLWRLTSGLNMHPELDVPGGNVKQLWLGDIVDNLGEDQLVIFCNFRHTVKVLAKLLRKQGFAADTVSGDQTDKRNGLAIDGFQSGKSQIVIGTYGTMGEGHTLTSASKMVLFETYPVPAVIDQAIGRIRRFGQTEPVTIWQPYCIDTVDDYYVNRMIPAKRSHSEGVYTAADFKEFLDQ